MASKKGGLGRGLSSLMSEAQSETGYSAEVEKSESTLKISEVHPNPKQPRQYFDEEKLEELSQSIEANGVLQPLLVRKDKEGYQIIAGERRYQACLRCGIEEVPVVIKDVDDQKVMELALIENLQRSDLNPIEEARGYKQLIDANSMTQDQVAKTVSKSRAAIANALRLLDLPEEVQDMLFDRKLTAGHARAILVVPFDDARIKLAEKVIAEGLSVRATERLAPLFSVGEQEPVKRTVTPQSFKKAARALRQAFDTNVRVKSVRGKNKIEIEFKDEEDLKRILDLMASEAE